MISELTRGKTGHYFFDGFEIIRSYQIVLCDKVIVCVFGSYDMFECVYVS